MSVNSKPLWEAKVMDNTTLFEMSDNVLSKSIADSKSGLTAKQLKAVNWYAGTNDLRLQLCNPPMQMNFVEKSTSEPLTVTLQLILDEYKEWNDNDKKARAKARRLEKEFQNRRSNGEI